MRTPGWMLLCGVLIAIGVVPALAQMPNQDGTDAFRVIEGSPESAGSREKVNAEMAAQPPVPLVPGAAKTVQPLSPTLLAANEIPGMQLAQAGNPAPVPPAAPASNPWIVGMTLYFWLPWWTVDATIDGLPQASSGGSSHVSTHTTNLGGGDGEFTISKGLWGFYGNVAGGYYGAKGEILKSDPNHLNRPDRSGYLHSSAITGQYALTYRIVGQPMDLSAWARQPQPVSVDLLAGGQTLFASQNINTQRENKTVTATKTFPVLGSRLSWDMTERWTLGVDGSLGGFGVSDVSLVWQANLTVAYRFRAWDIPSAVTLGFRGQGLQVETGSGDQYFKMNATMYGPLLGFSAFF